MNVPAPSTTTAADTTTTATTIATTMRHIPGTLIPIVTRPHRAKHGPTVRSHRATPVQTHAHAITHSDATKKPRVEATKHPKPELRDPTMFREPITKCRAATPERLSVNNPNNN